MATHNGNENLQAILKQQEDNAELQKQIEELRTRQDKLCRKLKDDVEDRDDLIRELTEKLEQLRNDEWYKRQGAVESLLATEPVEHVAHFGDKGNMTMEEIEEQDAIFQKEVEEQHARWKAEKRAEVAAKRLKEGANLKLLALEEEANENSKCGGFHGRLTELIEELNEFESEAGAAPSSAPATGRSTEEIDKMTGLVGNLVGCCRCLRAYNIVLQNEIKGYKKGRCNEIERYKDAHITLRDELEQLSLEKAKLKKENDLTKTFYEGLLSEAEDQIEHLQEELRIRGVEDQFELGNIDEELDMNDGQDEELGMNDGQDEELGMNDGQDEELGMNDGQDEELGMNDGQDEELGMNDGQDEELGMNDGQNEELDMNDGQEHQEERPEELRRHLEFFEEYEPLVVDHEEEVVEEEDGADPVQAHPADGEQLGYPFVFRRIW